MKIVKVSKTKLTEKMVYDMVRELGITSKYRGYHCIAEATMMYVDLVYRNKDTVLITKDIYPEIASTLKGLTPTMVERDIRLAINICWKTNRKALEELANTTLDRKPTNSEFIDLLAYNIYMAE